MIDSKINNMPLLRVITIRGQRLFFRRNNIVFEVPYQWFHRYYGCFYIENEIDFTNPEQKQPQNWLDITPNIGQNRYMYGTHNITKNAVKRPYKAAKQAKTKTLAGKTPANKDG